MNIYLYKPVFVFLAKLVKLEKFTIVKHIIRVQQRRECSTELGSVKPGRSRVNNFFGPTLTRSWD